MKLSLIVAVVCASLVAAKKKPKTKTTRIRFTGTFLPKHFTKGWANPTKPYSCEQCKNICAAAVPPKWLDEYWTCVKLKCSEDTKYPCHPTDWGVFPKTTVNTNTASTTPVITITSTTAPGPTSSLTTVSSTSSVAAKASTATSSPSHSLPPLRPSFITSMVPMRMRMMIEGENDD